MQHHKYSLTELENMIPWEKEIYLAFLQQYIERRKLKGTTAEWLRFLQYLVEDLGFLPPLTRAEQSLLWR